MHVTEDQFNYIINRKLESGKYMVGNTKEEFLKVFPIDKSKNKDEFIKELTLNFSHDLEDIVTYFDYMILNELAKLKDRLE